MYSYDYCRSTYVSESTVAELRACWDICCRAEVSFGGKRFQLNQTLHANKGIDFNAQGVLKLFSEDKYLYECRQRQGVPRVKPAQT